MNIEIIIKKLKRKSEYFFAYSCISEHSKHLLCPTRMHVFCVYLICRIKQINRGLRQLTLPRPLTKVNHILSTTYT